MFKASKRRCITSSDQLLNKCDLFNIFKFVLVFYFFVPLVFSSVCHFLGRGSQKWDPLSFETCVAKND